MLHLLARKVFYPKNGSDLSALHNEIQRGVVNIGKNNRYEFTYNAYNPPLLAFHINCIVVHDLLEKKLSSLIHLTNCFNKNTFYYPVDKKLEVFSESCNWEIIDELGVYEFLQSRHLIKCVPDQYKVCFPSAAVDLIDVKNPFSIRTAINSEKILIPNAIDENSFYWHKGVWIIGCNLFAIIDKFIDCDYYEIIST